MVKTPTKSQAEETADDLISQARDIGGNVQEVAGNLQKAVDTSLKDQPMTTLLLVGVVGFILGALWKS